MSKPPREYLYVIDVAKECFDVAEGDLNRAATLFRQIMPDADADFQQATLEYLSRLARKKIRLSVRYRSHLDFDQPAAHEKSTGVRPASRRTGDGAELGGREGRQSATPRRRVDARADISATAIIEAGRTAVPDCGAGEPAAPVAKARRVDVRP
jgi:hypothetical protein